MKSKEKQIKKNLRGRIVTSDDKGKCDLIVRLITTDGGESLKCVTSKEGNFQFEYNPGKGPLILEVHNVEGRVIERREVTESIEDLGDLQVVDLPPSLARKHKYMRTQLEGRQRARKFANKLSQRRASVLPNVLQSDAGREAFEETQKELTYNIVKNLPKQEKLLALNPKQLLQLEKMVKKSDNSSVDINFSDAVGTFFPLPGISRETLSDLQLERISELRGQLQAKKITEVIRERPAYEETALSTSRQEARKSESATDIGIDLVKELKDAMASKDLNEEELSKRLKLLIGTSIAVTTAYAEQSRTLELKSRASGKDIQQNVKDMKSMGGPADGPSVHDFHSLKIAMPSLWADRFGEAARSSLEDLYKKLWEGYESTRAWDIPEELPADVQIEDLIQIAEDLSLDPIVMETVREMGSYISEEDWYSLKPDERNEIKQKVRKYLDLIDQQFERVGIRKDPNSPSQNPHFFISKPDSFNSYLEYYDTISGSERRYKLVYLEDDSINNEETIIYLNVLRGLGFIVYPLPSFVTHPSNNIFRFGNEQGFLVRWDWYTDYKKKELKDYISSHLSPTNDGTPSIESDGTPSIASSSIEALAQLLEANSLSERQEDYWKRYPFTTFWPRSVNFGVLLTYKQKWVPEAYQVGELVKTIPLAPKEIRKFTQKTITKKGRKKKELESSLRVIGDQSQDTGRSESEVVKKARNETNFSSHAEASGSVGIFSFGGSTDMGAAASKDSARTKKKFREAVSKASQEFRQENRVEVETTDSTEMESTSSGEISNPNDELTVTYLFYELQRRYTVTEYLAEITPLALVGEEVPLPNEITESWLIRFDWILKRAILDDSFLPAFNHLKDTQLSRRVEIGIRKKAVERQLQALKETKEQLSTTTALRDKALERIDDAVRYIQDAAIGSGAAGTAATILTGGLAGLFGGSGDGLAEGIQEAAEFGEEAAQEALQRIDRELNRLQSRMAAASSALENAIREYAKVVRESLAREQEVLRLRVHIAQNILHYMHAIWEYEIEDQRYFRLHDIPVPGIDANIQLQDMGEGRFQLTLGGTLPRLILPSDSGQILEDVAYLDRLLGFKGNYMMFPLKENNYLTTYLSLPFLDKYNSVQDADQLSTMTKEELLELQRCYREKYGDNNYKEDGIEEVITTAIKIKDSETVGNEIVVPTNMLYVEALPGSHPLLEDFKLKHRIIDVAKAKAEVEALELDNWRRKARLILGDYDDPDWEKQIRIQGDPSHMEVDPIG